MIEISHSEATAQEPLVSVLMPAYGHEPYIVEAIEGVLAQTCDLPIGLIMAEDCSPAYGRAPCLNASCQKPVSSC